MPRDEFKKLVSVHKETLEKLDRDVVSNCSTDVNFVVDSHWDDLEAIAKDYKDLLAAYESLRERLKDFAESN